MHLQRQALLDLKPTSLFLVCIDSDGCVFDNMELKHKECFCPNIIRYWRLQSVSKCAREAVEFINLYSKWRGINRWPALVMTMDLLRERAEVRARHAMIPELPKVKEFLKSGNPLSNDGLRAFSSSRRDSELLKALEWSEAVNQSIRDIVSGVPPFPFVREALEKLRKKTDSIVVSQAPSEVLERDWKEHELSHFVRMIAGQESGTKVEQLRLVSEIRYKKDHVLMVGDAMGDLKAARANGNLFYPINPGAEEESWDRFNREAVNKFLNGEYAGQYEEMLVDEFVDRVPELAPWQMSRTSHS